MAFAAALALLVAAPAVLLASATSLTAPSSTSGVSGRRFSGERLREVPELRFTGWRSRWQVLNSGGGDWIGGRVERCVQNWWREGSEKEGVADEERMEAFDVRNNDRI